MDSAKRLTKALIEARLLAGTPVEWVEGGNQKRIVLPKASQRRLFSFLLGEQVREAKNLPNRFIDGLESAYNSNNDPASEVQSKIEAEAQSRAWRLHAIETQGFGGLNTWGSKPFSYTFEGESYVVEGANGSGKSSLVAAIIWALTGERPRDHKQEPADEVKPVFGEEDRALGTWPPIACYPPDFSHLGTPPFVRVTLTFSDGTGNFSKVERRLEDNTVSSSFDERFNVPSIFYETGLLMPTRLATLRFDERKGQLNDAVQKLTGLDDLVALGDLVGGLRHGGREYLSPLRKELSASQQIFKQTLEAARQSLAIVGESLPSFEVCETKDANGQFVLLVSGLAEKAGSLTSVVSADLSPDLQVSNVDVQKKVVSAIEAAKSDLARGFEVSSTWKLLQAIANHLPEESVDETRLALRSARDRVIEALNLHDSSVADSKFQLKVIASHWHDKHKTGGIDACPLCDADLSDNTSLKAELGALRTVGAAAGKALNDNLNEILEALDSLVPPFIRKLDVELAHTDPRSMIVGELRRAWVQSSSYSTIIADIDRLADGVLEGAPANIVPPYLDASSSDASNKVFDRIKLVERCLYLAHWYRESSSQWIDWWNRIAPSGDSAKFESDDKNISQFFLVLNRISEALAKSEPYRRAAEIAQKALIQGIAAAETEERLKVREEIANDLEAIKDIGALAAAVASDAINELSARIKVMLENTLLTERLRFKKASMNRKDGLAVHGKINSNLNVDATLIANTAWLRTVLWAFIFALREEAVQQLGADPLPLLVFDDPQATFDGLHRHRWAQHIATYQQPEGSNAQVLLISHDEAFLELVKVSGIRGREVVIVGAHDKGCVELYEGALLDRKWEEVSKAASPDWKSYVAKVREYVEGQLRIMLRAEDAWVASPLSGFVIGDSRNKIEHLHSKGLAPWDRTEFKTLINGLDKTLSAIKHLELAHHTGQNFGKAEALDVEGHWRKKLKPALTRGFRVAREYYHLHGRLNALHEPDPVAALPEGYASQVKSIPLRFLGRAAALTNGRMADGCIDMGDFEPEALERVVLGNHQAFQIVAPTLEPVAKVGDLLLVVDSQEPRPKSLVVALCGDRLLARRYEIADNHSNIAVLTAQSINPHLIEPPVVAHKATIRMHEVAGVLYGYGLATARPSTDDELCECSGASMISELTVGALGLVRVEGQSAIPYALDGQYLIIGSPINGVSELQKVEGRPVIAADSADRRYFKRLHLPDGDHVVLESLDSGGDYAPVLLSLPGKQGNCLEKVWPVIGVLFER